MPIPVGAVLLTVTDLVTHMHGTRLNPGDEAAAEAAVAFGAAQVANVTGFDVLDTDHAVTDSDILIAKGVALRVATQWFQNPLDRASYSGPDGMSYTPSPQVLSQIMSKADRLDLTGIAMRYGFAGFA